MHLSTLVSNLVQSWRESLKIFIPHNLKQFLLLTLNSWRQLWLSLMVSWGIMLYLAIILIAATHNFGAYLAYAALLALFCAATRPSVYLKSFIYYVYAAGVGLLFGLFFLGLQISMQLYLANFGSFIPVLEAIIAQVITIYIIILILFLLDAQKRILSYMKAFWRALIMIVYNLPFFMGISFCAYLGNIVWENGVGHLPDTRITLIGIIVLFSLIMSFYICLLTNFYVKRIHEQFDLYYGKK